MLEVNQLSRRYGGVIAVDNVSFNIGKGEIVGLLGHNGAGKTTIMKMLSGYLEPNQGSVSVGGINLADDRKKVQIGLGYLPENLPVYPEMTVADYLDYAADLKGLTNSTKYSEIKRAVAETDISAKLLSPISILSRGYKQRVGVAQALLGQPKLLILDEPTNGLDPEQTQHMRQLILDIAKEATVILSTHIMQEVEALCSRVLILRAGQLAIDEKLDHLRRSNHVLVDTSMPPGYAKKMTDIESIDDITQIKPQNDDTNFFSYRAVLTPESKQQSVYAALAQTIIDSKYDLFRLQPEIHDLETLFKNAIGQTTNQEGLENAA